MRFLQLFLCIEHFDSGVVMQQEIETMIYVSSCFAYNLLDCPFYIALKM